MSKYKAGDKFIIQIGFNEEMPFGSRHYIKGFRTLVFDDKGLDRLERYDADEKANADYNEGYEDGANAAWDCAKKIVLDTADNGLGVGGRRKAFGMDMAYPIFNTHTAYEAMEKLNEYEYNEIKVGDEVNVGEDGKGVVIGVSETNYLVWKADDTGGDFHEACWYGKYHVRKTGFHYYIERILDKIRGE